MGFVKRWIEGPVTEAAISSGHLLVRALGSTWRVRFVGNERVEAARRQGPGQVLYAFSHGVLLPLVYAYRGCGAHVLISESRDGEIIARITGNLGFGAVRGSSTRGGGRAIVRMAARAREGNDLAVTPDGPKGPRGSVGAGVPLIAQRAGVPLVPLGVAARPAYRARSWDRFLVPLPLARVWVVAGPPLWLAAGGADADPRERIERAIADAEREAISYARGRRPATEPGRVPA